MVWCLGRSGLNSVLTRLGLGDFTPDNVNALEDPCPLPEKERVLRRSLNEKEKLIYAPFSGVGGIVYDHDAVYIDLGGSHSHGKPSEKEESGESAPLVKELREMKSTLDEKLESARLQLFSNSDVITAVDVVESDEEDSEEQSEDDEGNDDQNLNYDSDGGSEQPEADENEGHTNKNYRSRSTENGGESDSDNPDDDESQDTNFDSQKQARFQEASDLFYSRFRHRPLQRMIYDDIDDFMNLESRANFDITNCAVQDINEEEDDTYKSLFVGGDYAESAKAMLDQDNEEDFGDFEEFDNENEEEDQSEGDQPVETDEKSEKREAMKKKLKEKFDMEYDEGDKDFYSDWKNEVEEQAKVF